MFSFWFYLTLLVSTVLGNWVLVRVRARRRVSSARKTLRHPANKN